jgi:hypothetical protein
MIKGQKMSDEQKLKLSIAHKGRKFSDEHRKKLSESHKGQIPVNLEFLRTCRKGVTLTEEHKRKIGAPQKGKPKNFSAEGRKRMRESMRGKKPWNYGMKGLNSGSDNPNCIADRSKVKTYEKRIGSLYWTWRRLCLVRDNKQCKLLSGECSGKLEVHHIKRWSEHEHLRYDVSNGITLCHFHHPRTKEKENSMQDEFLSLIS